MLENSACKVAVHFVPIALWGWHKMEDSVSQQDSLSLSNLLWRVTLSSGDCPYLEGDTVQSFQQALYGLAHEFPLSSLVLTYLNWWIINICLSSVRSMRTNWVYFLSCLNVCFSPWLIQTNRFASIKELSLWNELPEAYGPSNKHRLLLLLPLPLQVGDQQFPRKGKSTEKKSTNILNTQLTCEGPWIDLNTEHWVLSGRKT